MKRMHEERKDIFSGIREGVLTSPASIRNITINQNMEKDKLEKPNYGQHSFDTGFRTVDLLKSSSKPRSIVPASHGSSQVHAVPPLISNYINNSTHLLNPTQVNHNTLVKGSINPRQHSFQAHVPVGIGASVALQRTASTQRSALPSLKPTKLSTQIQLPIGNHVPGLPTVLTPTVVSRTASPNIATHGQSSDHRNDSRAALISDPHHHGLRGNTQATSQHSATIQVIASGTASLPHIPASFLAKGVNLGTSSGMLKINATSQSNPISSTTAPGSTFKLGLGKTYSGSSSIIIPATTSRSDHLDIRQNIVPAPYTRFPTALHPATTIIPANSVTNSESRSVHQVGYHPINTAYVLHDMGLQSFSHQLVRPPSSSVSMFAIDSPIRNLPAIPLVTLPAPKDNSAISSHANEPVRSEGLTIHGSLSIHNLYPNLQSASFQPIFSTTSLLNTNEAAVRPSILRKRPGESSILYSAQPTDKERNSSPVKKDLIQSSIPPAKIKSPPLLISHEKSTAYLPPSHSIVNITSDSKSVAVTLAVITTTATAISNSSKTKILINSVASNSSIEASPKKKPRKQLIITTEDKYASKPLINSNMTDDDEEFLKSNETMKDLTPPKTSVELTYSVSNMNSHKNLFTLANSSSTEMKIKSEPVDPHYTVNGIVSSVSNSITSNDSVKHLIYRRKPQVSIIGDYKINTKAAHNHFFRASDMKVKEEKPSSAQDRLITKGALEAASGWKLHYLTTQIDDLISIEDEISAEFSMWKDKIRTPCGSPTSIHSTSLSGEDAQLRLIHELIQGNIQRCKYSMEQLIETKQNMFKALVHKNKAIEILKKYKPKARIKKKTS